PRRPWRGTPLSRQDCGSHFRSAGIRWPRRRAVLLWCIVAQSASLAPFSLARRPGADRRHVTRGATLASRPRLRLARTLFLTPPPTADGLAGGTARARPFKATKSRSPAPLRQAERLRRPFQESARRDFEPLAPNFLKLRQHPPFVKA